MVSEFADAPAETPSATMMAMPVVFIFSALDMLTEYGTDSDTEVAAPDDNTSIVSHVKQYT